MRRHPTRPDRFAWLSLTASFLLFLAAKESRADKGRWTQPEDWSGGNGTYAVHMALLRGDGNPDHSRVLYWSTNKGTTFYGQERGWSPGNHDCNSTTGTGFTFRGAPAAPFDVFCAGHTQLADSRRLLVNGGNLPYGQNLGERKNAIYTAGTGEASGSWSATGTMFDGRWYATAVSLVDGRILSISGDRYQHLRSFGGTRNGSLPGSTDVEGDSVLRFGVDPGGRWDPSVLPAADAGLRPEHRQRFTSVDLEGDFDGQVFFGGLGASQPLDDAWILQRSEGAVQAGDYDYQWKRVLPTPRPLPRSDHVAVARENDVIVFGGRLTDGTARSDVWRLRWTGASFEWFQMTITGSTPARYGHAAVYDTFTTLVGGASTFMKRMLIFGGISGDGGSLIDQTKVYELRFDPANPSQATWHEHTPASLGDGVPSARYWHSLTKNIHNVHYYSETQSGHVATLFGGKLASGASDELWELWIFRDGTMGWKKRTYGGSPPSARYQHAAAHLGPGSERLFINGGVLAGGGGDAATYALAPRAATPSWEQWASAETPLAGHAASFEIEKTVSRVAEVYDSLGGQWFTDTGATLSQFTYPVSFLVPGRTAEGGRVYTMGKDNSTYYLDIRPQGTASSDWQKLAIPAVDFTPSSGVMYEPGKIMVAGGYGPTGKTRTLNTSSLTNTWQTRGDLIPRDDHNLVILPGGNVLAVGGIQGSTAATAVFRPQLWDPATGNWTDTLTTNPDRLAAQQIVRNYHSTGMLLPDGRVLSAGGEDPQSKDRFKAEIFCPPYLFKPDGTPATRPVIGEVVQRVRYGYDFSICMPGAKTLSSASLIRPGSTTHSFDQNQRYVPLAITGYSLDSTRVTVAGPADSSIAPAGDYLLFLVDGKGVPSVARWIRVGAVWIPGDATAPATVADLAAEAISQNTIYWTWTVPGDDGASGQPWLHKLVHSSSPITGTSFASASPVPNLPVPECVGGLQSYAKDGLTACTWYYSAIQVVDESGNYSTIGYSPATRTLCGGGGGGGFSAVRTRDEVGSAERISARAPFKPGASAVSLVPEADRGLLIASYEESASGVNWKIHRATVAALGGNVADLTKVTFQDSDGAAWRTRASLNELPGELGIRSRLRKGRVVFPEAYDLASIQERPPGFELAAARHSRLGDVGVESIAAGSNLAVAAGDTMSFAFVPTAPGEGEGQDCFFVVTRPIAASSSGGRSARPASETEPGIFALHQNQPNPFATTTRIDFSLPAAGRARIQILDPQGRRVRVLANSSFRAGRHQVTWDRRTDGGVLARPGIYFYEIEAGEMRDRRKLVVLP